MMAMPRDQAGVTAGMMNPAAIAKMQNAFKDSLKGSMALSNAGQTFKDMTANTKDMTKAMNNSFQGMQSKAGIIQKIVSTTMDFFAVGVSKTQKDFVGAMKKAFSEGDIAGAIDALINMRFQFVKLEGLAAPWMKAFEPVNKIFEAIGNMAAGMVANSTEFRQFIKDAFSADGMKSMREMADSLSKIVLQLVRMDWAKTAEIIERILQKIADFITFADQAHTNWQATVDFWKPGNTGLPGINIPGID